MGTRQTLFMILSMTIMMGIILSGVFTWQAMGFGAGFVGVWASRFVSTYIIVLPTVLLVSPVAQRFARWLDGRLSPLPQPSPRDVALDAWRANAAGHSGADFGPWLASLANDVSIWMPLGAFRGENSGQERAAEIYGAIAAASPRLTYETPFRVSTAGQTVVLEFEDHGTIAGMPYRNRIAASFDVKDGKIAAYREYFGDIDPAIFAMMTAQSHDDRTVEPRTTLTSKGEPVSIVHSPEFDAMFRHGKAYGPQGGPIHYVMGGQGPALMLIHGWMGSWYSWRKVMPLLATQFTVIVPDCRGYGDSHKPYAGYDGRTIKDELRAVVQSLAIEKLAVVGHDMGALIALLYAAEHRDEVTGLGYFDEPLVGYNLDQFTAFTADNPFVYWWFAFNAQPHIPALLWEGKEAQMVDHLLTAMIGDPRAISAEDKAEYVRGLRSPGGLHGSFGWYRDSLATGAQIREATATKLSCPVLAMNGQFGHPGVTEQMALVATNVTGHTIPWCGHMLAEEFPDQVAEAIKEVLA